MTPCFQICVGNNIFMPRKHPQRVTDKKACIIRSLITDNQTIQFKDVVEFIGSSYSSAKTRRSWNSISHNPTELVIYKQTVTVHKLRNGSGIMHFHQKRDCIVSFDFSHFSHESMNLVSVEIVVFALKNLREILKVYEPIERSMEILSVCSLDLSSEEI